MEDTCWQTKLTAGNERIIATFFFTIRCGLVITDASEGDDNRVFTACRLSNSLLQKIASLSGYFVYKLTYLQQKHV